MAKLSEKAKKIMAEVFPALIVTAGKKGKPNVVPKYVVKVAVEEEDIF